MSTSSNQTNPISTAIVPYNPNLPHVSIKAYLESVTSEVARRSIESAKYESHHFSQIASHFTERSFGRIITTSIIPPKGLKTDPYIDIEIFATATGDENPPIIIFSHGVGEPGNYRSTLEELASKGYTVLILTHPSSAEDPNWLTREQAEAGSDELANVMANNIQYVLSQVRKGALKIPGDRNRIILMGHSLGGAASIMVSRSDQNISGCVNLDGGLKGSAKKGNAKTDKVNQPLLMIVGDHEKRLKMELSELQQNPKGKEQEIQDKKLDIQVVQEWETLRSNSPNSFIQVIPAAEHMYFTDQPFRYYPPEVEITAKKVSDAMRAHTTVSQEVLKFLGFCLSR